MSIRTIQRPETWNMEVKHGDTWLPWSFEIQDETAAPITGFVVECHIKKSINDADEVKTLVDGDGFSVTGNLVTFDTEVDLPVGSYYYDIQLTLANGDIHTQYAGRIDVKNDITP